MKIKIQRRIIPYFNPWNISMGPFEVKVDPRSDGFENIMQNLLSTFFFLTLYVILLHFPELLMSSLKQFFVIT